MKTIASTSCYQRKIRAKSDAEDALPFASATPVPLRSDVVFNSILQVFGLSEIDFMGGRAQKLAAEMKADSKEMNGEMKEMAEKPQPPRQGPRFQFDALFGIDPSVPKDEITGTIPQSLMMMNSRRFRAGMAARPATPLGKILQETKDNREALKQVYLRVLAREPETKEYEYCLSYISDIKNRGEAFEDVMWCLMNSSEFISRR